MQLEMCMKDRKSGKKRENSHTMISDIHSDIKMHLRIEIVCSSETSTAEGVTVSTEVVAGSDTNF
jgi:hypothetical protein